MRDKKILTSKEWIPDINGKKAETVVTVYYDRRGDYFYVKCPSYLCETSPGYGKSYQNGKVVINIDDGIITAERP